MANSKYISMYKNKILTELLNDELFLQVLDVTEAEIENGLVYSRLYPYFYITGTQTTVKTYICIEINNNSNSRDDTYSHPQIVFNIISHQNDMKLNLAGVSAIKTDYLSEIIDEKFNGADGYGVGKLILKSNTAGSINEVYRYRQLVFKSIDINDSVCGD